MKHLSLISLLPVLLIFAACSTQRHSQAVGIASLKFLDEYRLPGGLLFDKTTVGGLSGIDYDTSRKVYYLISDDPGAFGPSRFYTAGIFISDLKIDSVVIRKMTPLLNADARIYSNIREDRIHSLDGESLRYNPVSDEMVYGSEGQRFDNKEGLLEIQQPTIFIAHPDGSYKDSFSLPANMHFHSLPEGPRHNSVFEGLAFSKDFGNLFASVEEPLYEDGPRAATGDSTGWTRIIQFDVATRVPIRQFAYLIDAVPYSPNPPGAFKINGVSDILAAGKDKLIVIERAYITGRKPSYVRVYLADLSSASDISSVHSIPGHASIRPISKKLLLDMEVLGRHIDNIEGVSFGPVLANGHRSLVFVADDNFSNSQIQQFLLFEVMP